MKLQQIGTLSKNAYLELNYFCMQHYEKKVRIREIEEGGIRSSLSNITGAKKKGVFADPCADAAIELTMLKDDVDLVERTVREIDPNNRAGLLEAVTTGTPYEKLVASGAVITCGRRQFYDKRKAFFLTLQARKRRGVL